MPAGTGMTRTWPLETLPVFQAHPWLWNGHAMTVAAAFLPRPAPRAAPSERRPFHVDGETTVVACCDRAADPHAPALVLLHGLCGSADSGYMVGTAAKGRAAGFHVVRLNMRGCGDTAHLAPTLYHAGLTGDLACVLRELLAVDRPRAIVCVGFSLGGNILLRLAAELGEDAPAELLGIVAVSPPIDLEAAADALERPGMNEFYQRHFIGELRALLCRKANLFPKRYPLDGLDRVRTLRELDDRFTAPFCGFDDARHYYRSTSPLARIPDIRVPTLVISSQDDSLVPAESFDRPELRGNRWVRVLLTDRGGHVGFLARRPSRSADGVDADRWWVENRIVQLARWLVA